MVHVAATPQGRRASLGRLRWILPAVAAALVVALLPAPATAAPGDTTRASVSAEGTQATGGPSGAPDVSADGRYVAFASAATNLVAEDTNGVVDVFVKDRLSTAVARVSVTSDGAQAVDGAFRVGSRRPAISADGRYVAFDSGASNLVPADTGAVDIFVHDRDADANGVFDEAGPGRRATTRVSLSSTGGQANASSFRPALSGNGRYVAFESEASNIVPTLVSGVAVGGDANRAFDVFVYDRHTATTTRESVSTSGEEATGSSACTESKPHSLQAALSFDGSVLAFTSGATNLVAGDTNGHCDVFVRDRAARTTTRVSVATTGAQGDDESTTADLSADGALVAFESKATNLVAGDTNAASDVFVRDRQAATTGRQSVDSTGAQANAHSVDASISADGRIVAFESNSVNLVAGDTNSVYDIFVRDRLSGATTRESVDSTGAQGTGTFLLNIDAAVSADGRVVAFDSAASTLVPDDTNGVRDVFVHEHRETFVCRGLVATIVGTEGPDAIVGTDGADVIAARGGDDTVSAAKGNDVVCGGDGADTVDGGGGDDTLDGGGGDDTLRGDAGNDTLDGGAGVDACDGGPGAKDRVVSGSCERVSGVP
ncbi:MAG: calcium-binding protein [Actinomycetota bacterium]|nr:calcium-binding protein [Actinomycetota bacterium]